MQTMVKCKYNKFKDEFFFIKLFAFNKMQVHKDKIDWAIRQVQVKDDGIRSVKMERNWRDGRLKRGMIDMSW